MEFFQVYHRKRKRDQSDKPKLSHFSKNFINSLFEKKITYPQPCSEVPTLNKGLAEKWSIPQYMEMKEQLNNLKTNLNDKDMITWHEHTRKVNPAGKIGPEIRHQLRPELCTQAWCKFYEIASTFLEVDTNKPFCSAHLCEAPGAFITSLNQYLFTKGFQSEWRWMASTLNPYYEGNNIAQMIDEDRFIKFTYGNWYFGEDNTGNLMSEKNLSGLMSELKENQVDLVTADGSIDCQFNPAEQENVVSRLQHCEVIAGLHILRPGGTLVVKMFTLLECTSVCLMYLLSCLFEEVTVFKPSTSKGGNSEVYVVSKGYKGRESCNTLLEQLVPLYFGEKEPTGCLFPFSAIPESFLDHHTNCVQFFVECQMSAIQRNLDLFKVMTPEERSTLEAERDYCVECFFNRYQVKPLISALKIMKLPKNHRRKGPGIKREFADKAKLEGKFIGSFQERQELSLLPWKQKVVAMETYEEEMDREDNSLWIKNCRGPLTDELIRAYQPVTGAPVEKIESSKFCPGFYLAQTQEVIQNVQSLFSSPNPPEELARTVAKKLIAKIDSCLQYHSGTTFENVQHIKTEDPSRIDREALQENMECESSTIDDGAGQENCAKEETDSEIKEGIGNDIVEGIGYEIKGDIGNDVVEGIDDIIKAGIDNDTKGDIGNNAKDEIGSGRTEVMQTHTTDLDRDKTSDSQHDCQQLVNKLQSGICDIEKKSDDGSIKIESKDVGASNRRNVQNGDNLHKGDANLMEGNGISKAVEPMFVCELVSVSDGDVENYKSNILEDVVSKTAIRRHTRPVPRVLTLATCSKITQQFEVKDCPQMLKAVLHILQTVKEGDHVLIEMGACLTRFTAGLLYILYKSFMEVGFVHSHGLLLQRHLVCINYQCCPITMQDYLRRLGQSIDLCQSESVLEIIPVMDLLEDDDFCDFLKITNTNLLQSFITTVVKREKQLLNSVAE